MSHLDTFYLWYDLVENYTQREFTKISDRLIAILGLARIYSDMIRNPTYVAGLQKEDLIRGLLWHVQGVTLIPSGSANNIPALRAAFLSQSWASVGYKVVKNDLKAHDGFCALLVIEDIYIDLVNMQDPFGAVKSGRISITGPSKRLARLYHKDWTSAEAPMSKLERYVSKIVEGESQGSVLHKYSSPPGGHFTVLLMLWDINLLYLLVLEATSHDCNDIVYRRVGILKLRYTSPLSYARLGLIAELKKRETSISARLGLYQTLHKVQRPPNDVFEEVKNGNWAKETVMIV